MSAPLWLIAEREFRAYVATISFWIALAVGPLALAGALGLAAMAATKPPPATLSVQAADPAASRAALAAVTEAAALDGRHLAPAAPGTNPDVAVVLTRQADGSIAARFGGAHPLSPLARALVMRTLQRDAALEVGHPSLTRTVTLAPTQTAAPKHVDSGAAARFALVMMLWLTLTGSLGMLLQAMVRERTNRALESLLAAARPWEVVFGKLAGVGAVSLLVLAVWLGAAAAFAPLAPAVGGLGANVLSGLADPLTLIRAVAIYVLAFGFYGLVTLAVGAAARDTAAAQNLSRPMFAVLLAAFFAALAAAGGASAKLSWLVFVPPFTPFMLLLKAPGAVPVAHEASALALLAAAAAAAGWWAVRGLDLGPRSRRRNASGAMAPDGLSAPIA